MLLSVNFLLVLTNVAVPSPPGTMYVTEGVYLTLWTTHNASSTFLVIQILFVDIKSRYVNYYIPNPLIKTVHSSRSFKCHVGNYPYDKKLQILCNSIFSCTSFHTSILLITDDKEALSPIGSSSLLSLDRIREAHR